MCIARPQLSPGSVHASGERHLRRDVLPDDVTLTRNVAFLSAFREFSGGRTLFGAIRRYQEICDDARPSLIEVARELSAKSMDRGRIRRAMSIFGVFGTKGRTYSRHLPLKRAIQECQRARIQCRRHLPSG